MRALGAFLALAILTVGRASSAEGTSCALDFEGAQESRNRGAFLEAREKLRRCAQPTCPVFIQKYCTQWSDELVAQMPSIVIVARDAKGADVSVSVEIDGVDRGEQTALPMDLDPGEHDVQVRSTGFLPEKQRLIVRAGERARSIVFSLRPVPTAPVSPPPVVTFHRNAAWWSGWIAAGVSVAGAATFAALAIHGVGREGDLELCGPGCPHDQVQSVRTEYYAADIALGVAAVAAVTATILFIVIPKNVPVRAAVLTF